MGIDVGGIGSLPRLRFQHIQVHEQFIGRLNACPLAAILAVHADQHFTLAEYAKHITAIKVILMDSQLPHANGERVEDFRHFLFHWPSPKCAVALKIHGYTVCP